MPDNRLTITTDDGTRATAVSPVIISASRSTDIPAFYADWFIRRLEKGYIRWVNSFNPHRPFYVSFAKARVIVFWSKNPAPVIPLLEKIDRMGYSYYFQYTLTDYEKEGFEPGVPSRDDRIRTFIRLSERIGKERVIWRFDPVLLTDSLDVKGVLDRIQAIGDRISPYTEKLVFSFVEMKYGKVKRQAGVHSFRGLSWEEKQEVIAGLIRLNERWSLTLASCADETDYSPDIVHNKCIDDELIRRICPSDSDVIRFLDAHPEKDPGQRPACRCIRSKDIGQYDTCLHGCVYCYATDHVKAQIQYEKHLSIPEADTITGEKPVSGPKKDHDISIFLDET